MKKLFALFALLFALCSLPFALFAQTPYPVFLLDSSTKIVAELKPYLAGGKVGQLIVTVRPKDLYITSSKQYYVNYFDTAGAAHRFYLGWLTGHIYENSTVFSNSGKTQFWYIQYSKNNIPYKIILPNFLFQK